MLYRDSPLAIVMDQLILKNLAYLVPQTIMFILKLLNTEQQ